MLVARQDARCRDHRRALNAFRPIIHIYVSSKVLMQNARDPARPKTFHFRNFDSEPSLLMLFNSEGQGLRVRSAEKPPYLDFA